MPAEGTIRAEHLWKRFRADKGRRYLRDRIAEARPGRRRDAADRYRWVLRDIDLHCEPGDAVGLIGANGSGKSTLLKILTGVMYPYAGRLDVVGRVGALLEVRAGLHGDLTGRENINLYGALLGLSRADVEARFDDIVDFSVLGEAIDRQVKFYSSGMQMRLGFSVAAFLEPDILLVDEALAVGDAFFQQRCLDRMRDLLRQGTTLVLVSHDLAAVESVCTRGVWLRDGVIEADTDVRSALGQYRNWIEDAYHAWIEETSGEAVFRPGDISVLKAEVGHARTGGFPVSQEPLALDLVLESPEPKAGVLCFGITEGTATPIFIVSTHLELRAGRNTVRCTLPYLPLPGGRFYGWLEFDADGAGTNLPWQPTIAFTVEGPELARAPTGVMRIGAVQVDATWEQPDPPAPHPDGGGD